jgi:phosphatidylcholine synthase
MAGEVKARHRVAAWARGRVVNLRARETRHRAAAWGVHIYTACGLPLAFLAAIALARADARLFFLAMWTTCVIDATDGTLARRVKVREVLPTFDGRKLDDIVDYLTFVFLPVLALPALGILGPSLQWVSVLPLFASAYGFCQERAKTQESFVGFPSYWNVLVLYLYVLKPDPMVSAAILVVLSILVFVPIHYIYPSKARMLKRVTLGLGALWALLLIPLCFAPDGPWARTLALLSTPFPVYYLILSAVHHVKNAKHETPVTT